MALSIGIRSSISLLSAIQATRPLTITLVGLSSKHTSFFLDTLPYDEFSRSTAGRLAFQAAPFPMPFRLSQHRAYPAQHEGLHLPFVHSVAAPYVRRCVRTVGSVVYRHSRSCLLYPRGPRSGLGYSVPVHQRLNDLIRPARGHIPISPTCGLYGMPSLCR